jgi:hypothetical protein
VIKSGFVPSDGEIRIMAGIFDSTTHPAKFTVEAENISNAAKGDDV